MNRIHPTRSRSWVGRFSALAAGSILLLGGTGAAKVEPTKAAKVEKKKAVDADADQLLRRATNYIAGLQNFRVHSTSIDEIETKEGQKIQIAAESDVAVSRPNKLRSEQLGDGRGMMLTYDGKTVTLLCKSDNTYGQIKAPPTLDGMIDMARKNYGLDAPGADLLYADPYDGMMEQVTSGRVIGPETVNGVSATHLAFRSEGIDWQIWIQDGNEPLPLRYVITTKTLKTQPQFTVNLSKWEQQLKPTDVAFEFAPPKDAKKVDKLPTSCGGKK